MSAGRGRGSKRVIGSELTADAVGLSRALDAARSGAFTIATQRASSVALTLDDAYEIARDLERKRTNAGWHPAGWKLGFTNQALWSTLGLASPIRARVYQETLCADNLKVTNLVEPRIEPEIVIGIGAELAKGSDADAVAAAVEWIAVGLEVVQCHFTDWEMSPAEAVADAGLHAALAIGPATTADAEAVRGLSSSRCNLLLDGKGVASGSGADVLGGPLEALMWLLRGSPDGLHAGEIVSTGTLTPAFPIRRGERWEHRLTATIPLEPVQLHLVEKRGDEDSALTRDQPHHS